MFNQKIPEQKKSSRNWAAIVYGRTHHLDFRFVTTPHDFTEPELNWAAAHILATTHQARNLASQPRWSLFKNKTHCIVGVTCMVRDLIGKLGQDSTEVMTKDDLGRPLYVFVGYATRLNQSEVLSSLPAYTAAHLVGFKPLYQQIEKVWLVKDYDQKSRHSYLSPYLPLDSAVEIIDVSTIVQQKPIQLNHQTKQPDKIFSWANSNQQNDQLWIAGARCLADTSICLNIKGKSAPTSPFLNQTVTQSEELIICDRLATQKSPVIATENKISKSKSAKHDHSLQQIITNKAKKDLDLTLGQAAKITLVGQDLFNNLNNFNDLGNRSNTHKTKIPDLDSQDATADQKSNFGFKSKNSASSTPEQNWF